MLLKMPIGILLPLDSFFSSFSIASDITEIFIESTDWGINCSSRWMGIGHNASLFFKCSINLQLRDWIKCKFQLNYDDYYFALIEKMFTVTWHIVQRIRNQNYSIKARIRFCTSLAGFDSTCHPSMNALKKFLIKWIGFNIASHYNTKGQTWNTLHQLW